jgi:molecular chaperone DnaJ
MTTAALGGEIESPTLDGGRTRVKVPAGVQSGKQLRLRSKGMPTLQRAGMPGDLYIELAVETPVNLSRRQEELLREFEAEARDNSPENQDFFSKVKDFWERMRG